MQVATGRALTQYPSPPFLSFLSVAAFSFSTGTKTDISTNGLKKYRAVMGSDLKIELLAIPGQLLLCLFLLLYLKFAILIP